MRDKAERAIEEFGLLNGYSGVLCAYSGGADSSVMLVLMREICAERGLTLRAIHVHHGIRGEEADRDERFCRSVCEELGIPYICRRVDAPGYAAEHKTGIEEAARELRYRAIDEVREPHEAVATAHNATDNAETVFYNLIRGSGLKGLSGIPPKRGYLIRPVIFMTREEIREYAADSGIEYVSDSTNEDVRHPRNLIRSEMIPEARKINPSLEATLISKGAILRREEEFIRELAERIEILRDAEKNTVSVDAAKFALAEEPIRYRVLRDMFSRISDGRLSAVNCDSVSALAKKAVPHSRTALPGRVSAVIENGRLVLRSSDGAAEMPVPEGDTPIGRGLEGAVSHGRYELFISDCEGFPEELKKARNVYKLFIFEKINFDTIKKGVFVRSKRPGDAYRARSMTKTLKKLMNEGGIPAEERSIYPVVCDGEGVVWLPGFSVADRCYPAAGEKITYICCGKK